MTTEHETMTIRCPKCTERVATLRNPTTKDRLGSYRQVDVTDQWKCNVCGHAVVIKARDAGAPCPSLQLLRAVEVDLRHDLYGDDRKRLRAAVQEVIRQLGGA